MEGKRVRLLVLLRRSKGRSVTVPVVVLNTFSARPSSPPPLSLRRRRRRRLAASTVLFSPSCSCLRSRRQEDGKRRSRMAQKRNLSWKTVGFYRAPLDIAPDLSFVRRSGRFGGSPDRSTALSLGSP